MIKKYNTLQECEKHFDNCHLYVSDNDIICEDKIPNSPWLSNMPYKVGHLEWRKEGGAPEFVVEISSNN